ncbi:MAG: DUF2851 family protein [Chloroflexi bacterium]|nr:DUF2851 family protein [Chloroflexota bacterium]
MASERRNAHGTAVPGEALLAHAWAERLYDPDGLVDGDGARIQVVFPGRRWGGPGPDFKGAVVALADGTLLRGDVEVHARASGWLRHGHGNDPRYRQVVLHVVGAADQPVLAADGRALRTVVVQPARVVPLPARDQAPSCTRHGSGLAGLLEESGLRRFAGHAARYEADIAAVGAEQALWRGLLESMGYAENRTPFGRLADLVPWCEVSRLARGGAEAVEGLLSEASGLGSTRSAVAQERAAWTLCAVRPANHPLRRIEGLARLSVRWAGSRDRFTAMAEQRVLEAARAARPVIDGWAVASPWIGGGRARVVGINVLLPWAAARGLREAEAIYRRAPAEPASRPVQHMAMVLGLSVRQVGTACLRQGLLQVYREACERRWCEGCALGGCGAPVARSTSRFIG